MKITGYERPNDGKPTDATFDIIRVLFRVFEVGFAKMMKAHGLPVVITPHKEPVHAVVFETAREDYPPDYDEGYIIALIKEVEAYGPITLPELNMIEEALYLVLRKNLSADFGKRVLENAKG